MPYVAGYQGGRRPRGGMRSSTMFIKDGSELIGMLCINFDAAKYSRNGAGSFCRSAGPIRSPAPALGWKTSSAAIPTR